MIKTYKDSQINLQTGFIDKFEIQITEFNAQQNLKQSSNLKYDG